MTKDTEQQRDYLNGNICFTCGSECIDKCSQCGAPQCCPKCCAETIREIKNTEHNKTPPDLARMEAYYYAFEPTGMHEIDCILSAVAWAGKAFHHTDDWNEQAYDRGTPVEWIQCAAIRAAKILTQRISELEKEVEQAFEKGVKSVMSIRCMQHRDIQQINNTEITGGECGACVQEQAELRGEKRGFEAARERDSGYSYHDPDSPYPSSDPEMRGVRFVEGSYVYKDFDDYKQQKG